MGGLFKPKVTTTKQPFERNPWEPQQQYLKDGFAAASTGLDNAMAQNGQITDYTADMNAGQAQDIAAISNFGHQTAGDVSQAALSLGMNGMENIGAYGQNASTLFNQANQDKTGQIIANGQQFANDPYLQTQIDGAIGDVRTAFDRSVGDINAGATGTGNINSTRAGALEAMSLKDSMDRATNIDASMRGAAYQNGLDRSMALDGQRTQDALNANSQLRDSGALGLDFATQGLAAGSQGLQDSLAANTMFQQQAQNEITGQQQKTQSEMDLIQKYMSLVGGSYGENGFQTNVKVGQSPFQTIVGGAATLAGTGMKIPGFG